MQRYTHKFVEEYRSLVGFGFSREVDEASLVVCLQKFSDDRLMEVLKSRLSDEEILQTVEWITGLLRKHLNKGEYHRLFLQEEEGFGL